LAQIAAALLAREEFGSKFGGMLNVTVLFPNVGLGKSGRPCERMHAAALR
jgi:hypothetical protein